jgi:flavodoxin
MRRTLVIYYSYSGNTRTIAEMIHRVVGGDLVEILPVEAYPKKYQQVLERSKEEIRTREHPPVRLSIDSLEYYDTIFIRTPNWWSSVASPVLSFLLRYDFHGKRICPFLTHGGGGVGHVWRDLADYSEDALHEKGLALFGTGGPSAEETINGWIQSLKIEKR